MVCTEHIYLLSIYTYVCIYAAHVRVPLSKTKAELAKILENNRNSRAKDNLLEEGLEANYRKTA